MTKLLSYIILISAKDFTALHFVLLTLVANKNKITNKQYYKNTSLPEVNMNSSAY